MPGMTSIDGLVSNLDTTAIVDAIINAERFNVDLLQNRQTEATNQLTTYNSISALMVALQTGTQPLLQSSLFDTPAVVASNEDAVTVTSNGAVPAGTYALSVDALAANHQVASQGYDDPASASLGTGTVQIQIGTGSTHTIVLNSSNNTLTGLKNEINAAGIGITASIINDGSASNAYRLLLTANDSGTDNAMSITTNLSGGTAPNFSTATFDTVEPIGTPLGTSAISLGAAAGYTGSDNKTYTFTVAGSGAQTVGTDTITVNWTDGTNSGSFDVTDVDTEVALTGDGADGLTLSFAAGTLNAGDRFQVQTFAPLLQAAADARVSLGSGSGGGSPIVITSSSNEITDLIDGLTITLKDTTTSPVIITASIDKDTIKQGITGMLDKYNEVMRAIDKQFTYNQETQEAGTLLGDQFLLTLQSGLRSQMTGAISGLPKALNMLRAVGIQTAGNGLMTLVDSSKLSEMLDSDPDGVRKLFIASGSSSNALIRLMSAGEDTIETDTGYDIDITQAATRMALQGAAVSDPADTPLTLSTANNKLKLRVDGILSDDLVLAAKQYNSGAELASEIQDKIDGDAALGGRGVQVEWIDLGATGYLKITSGSYGSAATMSFDESGSTALTALGLGSGMTEIAGRDVAGTINGEAATGVGRFLTGNDGNSTTAGMRLEVRVTESGLQSGAEGTITFTRGFAARLERAVDAISRANDGSIARRTKGIQAQIDDLKEQIADQEERLAVRREKLFARFTELEKALNQFQSQGQFLEQQLSYLSQNTQMITSNR
jgi:flagellar hook-associated protein 2